ncbi:DEAD/DEAH box helicase [Phycicoccus sp. DTK01]|uniref:DEAD/DEAH box helicase n=1 Tax=Phycicoccus sp. DTK01 TaxID=2785745 RepID=UPI001A8F8EE4|nr:DEAD/DEAH box helicase [Phycicoccus sp. DTK01]
MAVEEQSRVVLGTYAHEDRRLAQDANIERSIAEGAYAKRQLFELVQNAADAMRGEPGRCEVILTDHTLYVANSGRPFTVDGAIALMGTHASVKRDDQIGRFGLGFKSLLAVTDSPRIYSRSGSFVFDKEASAEKLAAIVPGLPHYPVMRWARAVDPRDAAREDAVLDQLMKWATTVIVAPVHRARDLLASGIAGFPAEFLLFSQHVERLGLEDRGARGTARSIALRPDDSGFVTLDDANRKSVWAVRSVFHHPSRSALEDGGYSAAREQVELSWAAPLEGAPKGIGTFWAYFPTESGTTLSGIVNAPWKLADDRESLLVGRFNEELLTEVLPPLVASSLSAVHDPARPTLVLSLLPARGKEDRNAADAVLNDPVMRAVADQQCIPTLAGGLRHPKRVKLHPEGLTAEQLQLWAAACPDPENWVSHAVTSAEHRAKVTRLMGYHNRYCATLVEWVEHLVKEPTIDGAAAAVQLVASLVGSMPGRRDELTKARVLLLDDGTLDGCRRGQVFLPGGEAGSGKLIIDPVLAGDESVLAALDTLGIKVFDNAGALRSELSAVPVQWERVWQASRKNTVGESEAIFRDVLGARVLYDLRVRVTSGKWKAPGDAYLSGDVIPANAGRDSDFLVDPRFHQQDRELMEALGLVSAPRRVADAPREGWRDARLQWVRDEFRKQINQQRLPDESIDVDQNRVLWPLEPMTRLSDEGRRALTEQVLRQLLGDETWKVTRRGGASQQGRIGDPTWQHVREHGRLRTPVGVHPISRCLRWDDDLAVIDGVPQPLPLSDPSVTEEQAKVLRLKSQPGDLTAADWVELLRLAKSWTDEQQRFLLYAWAAFLGQPPPERIRVRSGKGGFDCPADRAAVTYRTEIYTSLVAANVPCLLATSEADFEALRDNWGLADGEDMLTETVDYESAGEPYLLVDRFPPLRNMLDLDDHVVTVLPCKRLEVLTSTPGGQQSRPLPQYLQDRSVLVTAESPREVLLQVARALESTFKPDVVLRRMEEQRRNRLRQDIAKTSDVLDKLVLAVGVDELRAAIPSAALEALRHESTEEISDRQIAQLALAVDGYSVLQGHVPSLKKRGLEPPSVWAGKRTAREWVRELGFPVEFAGFSGSSRAAELEVEGPPILGELHEYQKAIGDRVKALLDPTGEMRRGLLPLPTGAGKTRVAVQALVEHMSESEVPVRVLWLAETDELCEQATQTWSQVWRAIGRAGTPLTLSRLWSGNEPNERDGHQVVVASLAKLDNVIKRDGDWGETYGWLVGPSIIVVDEAHRSIGQQYTRALSAMAGTKRVAEMTVPLLGLTATPFRGFNLRETEQLAGRYHNNLLDEGVFPDDDVYGYLQDHEVLARITHRELQGADLELNDEELAYATQMRRLPDTVENRLGKNDERNTEIVRSVLELASDQTALLFATSVENAKVLAALLTYHGVEARAVAGTTDPHARRRYIEDFKAKRVRVLTNYNVFTEGFDVPKVDAVFITRPTFSPNVYQQMIGRGLRGPLNGGKENVLIVNVADNLTNFGDEFAFRHFEHLWGRGRRP